MMIRSLPPASAHFAERPVPGARADDRAAGGDLGAQPRQRLVSRHAAVLDQLVEAVRHREREGGVVDVGVELVELDPRGVDLAADRLEQRRVGLGVVEDLALGRDRRHTAQGDEEHGRPGRRVQLGGDDAADLPALVRRRAHQRDRRVVHVEVPVAVALRHRLHRPEVDHVERAERDDLWDPAPAGGLEPLRNGGEHTAGDEVAELGRRHVERPGDEPRLEQLLHRAATRPGLVEDEHLVAELLQALPRRRHRLRS